VLEALKEAEDLGIVFDGDDDDNHVYQEEEDTF